MADINIIPTLINSVQTISILAGLVSGIVAYKRWSKSLSLKRADYVNELFNRIRTNELISDAIYIIDYDIDWYSPSFHESGLRKDEDNSYPIEKKIDYTFAYFSYICYLYENKIIGDEDFIFFEYHVNRIFNSEQAIDYLYNIYHFSKAFNSKCSFHYLIKYGNDHKLIGSDFEDKEAYKTTDKYHKYLPF